MFNVIGKGITVKDPELAYSQAGAAYCRCTLVNNEEFKGEKIGHFTNVVMFGDVAEDFAEEVTKGCLVEIKQGILKHPVRTYKGRTYYNTEVVILDYELIKKFEPKEEAKPASRRTRK